MFKKIKIIDIFVVFLILKHEKQQNQNCGKNKELKYEIMLY